MQKISYVIILILIFSMLTSVLFLSDTVKASEGVILLTNWDDVSSGLNENETGTPSGYFAFKNMGQTDYFRTSTDYDLSPYNSFEFNPDSSNYCKGWWNLTTDFDYIYEVNFSVYQYEGTGNNFVQMDFYNGSDVVISLQIFNGYGVAQEGLKWYDISTGWNYIYNTNTGSGRYYVVFHHTATNQFYISYLNSGFSVLGSDNLAGAYAGNYYTFDKIYIYQTSNQPGATGEMFIDNFYIDLTPNDFEMGDYDGGWCSNPIETYAQVFEIDTPDCTPDWLCILWKNFFDWDECIDCDYDLIPVKYIEHETEASYCQNIRHVILPVSIDQLDYVSDDPSDYTLIINDEYIGTGDYIYPYDNEYAIVWADVNKEVDGKILFSFYSKKNTGDSGYTTGVANNWYWYGLAGYFGGWGSTKVHNSISNFYDGVLSGTYPGNFKLSVCWYYNESCNVSLEPWKLPIIDKFDQAFGTGDTGVGYIEFLGYDENCYYKINRKLHVPTVVYNMTGYGEGGGTKTYLFQINKVRNGTHDQIVYNGFIEVANKDYERDVRELQDFEFEDYGAGQYYIMCYNTSSYGTVLEEFAHRSMTITVCPEDKYTPPAKEETYYGLPYWVPWIIGIFITLFVTMSPYIIAVYISRKTRSTELPRIPGLLYVGFFFMGLTISVLMELLPSWLPFIILFGMVVYFAVQWLYGKKAESTEGE